MDLVKEMDFLKDKSVSELKGVDLSQWLNMVDKLHDRTYTKDEVARAYLLGFTSGELLRDNPHYNTRQALYANLERVEPNNRYREINKKNRVLLGELITYYKAFIVVETSGDLSLAEDVFKNNRNKMVNYYLDNGGTRDIWEQGSVTQTKYIDLFQFMDTGKAIEHVISDIKSRETKTGIEQQLLSISNGELNSMKAAYGRNKKQRVLELILTGVSKDEILTKYSMSEKQYIKHYKNVAKKVHACYTNLSNKRNHIQKIKYGLRVVGDAEQSITEILQSN